MENTEAQANNTIKTMLVSTLALTVLDHSVARDGIQGTVADRPVRFIRRQKGWQFVIDVHVEVSVDNCVRWMPMYVNMTVESKALMQAWDDAVRKATDNDFELSCELDRARQDVVSQIMSALNI